MKFFDVIVIGGGISGCEAAKKIARYNKKVLLVEKEYIGGTCLNFGCVPSKFYLSVAKRYEEIKHDVELGLIQGAVKPQLKFIMEKQREVVKQLRNGMMLELNQNYVEIIFGEAELNLMGNEKQVQIGGDLFCADYIILANGSSSIIPSCDGIEEYTPFLYQKHHLQSQQLFVIIVA